MMFNNNDYRRLRDQYGYDERLSSTNGDSTSYWSYDGNFGRQEYSYEHPYGSYEYANEIGGYNQGWSSNYLTYDSYSL